MMRYKMKLVALSVAVWSCMGVFAQFPGRFQRFEPTSTLLFAHKDSVDLFLDVYDPAPGSETTWDGKDKPTIVYVFPGGFTGGSRTAWGVTSWYSRLCREGYRVIAIDYRLALKGMKEGSLKYIVNVDKAIEVAVDDLFSAISYILENAQQLGVRPDGIVLAGSSAGAITVLQAEWDLCNGHASASMLPQGFNFAGVMAFSGAIFSKEGRVRYGDMEPCPHFLCHGTDDNIVTYKKYRFLNLNFAGTGVIAKTFIRKGYNYKIMRFDGRKHEIATSMMQLFDPTVDFLENYVTRGLELQSDSLVTKQ